MSDTVKRIEYYYTEIPDRPGAGAKVLNALKTARINLLACSGFPIADGRAQVDFVPSNQRAFLAAARRADIKLVGPKIAFLIQGEDRVGAVTDIVTRLGQARINVTALTGIAAGKGRYGVILWVKPRKVSQAAQVLGVS